MTRDELLAIVERNRSDTLLALRLREALGLPKPPHKTGRTYDRSAKSRKYRDAKRLMKQRHGVRL